MNISLKLGSLALLLVPPLACKPRAQTDAALKDQDTTTPLASEFQTELNLLPQGFVLDFDKIAVKEWEGDGSSGVGRDYVRPLKGGGNAVSDAEYAALKQKYTKFGMDFEKSWIIFHTNASIDDKPMWVADHMFTKAVTSSGEHVRVNPYFRVVPYDDAGNGKQPSANELKKVMKAGDIIVFWHPEMNDYKLMGEAGQKESVKLRSTHAGLGWYDGDKIWALNSPHGYHSGWFDITNHYPFHIFRIAPNAKSKAGQAGFKYNFNDQRAVDALGEMYSLYAANMSIYFKFPGDYNGGDPLDLFTPELTEPFHNNVMAGVNIPDIPSIKLTNGRYGFEGQGTGQSQLYCAEYVWTSANMALNMMLPQGHQPKPAWEERFNFSQYADDSGQSKPKWDRVAALRQTLNQGGWTQKPAFIYEPYTLWDLVESFLWTYYREYPRSVRAKILVGMKPAILKNMGVEAAPVEAQTLAQRYAAVLDPADPSKFKTALEAAGGGDKGKTLNFFFDAIVAALLLDQDQNQAVTEQRKGMLQKFAVGMMVSNATGTPIPMRFVPPHSFILEAQKLDSNIVYVASALPADVLKANPTPGPVNIRRPTPEATAQAPQVQPPPQTAVTVNPPAQPQPTAPTTVVTQESDADRRRREDQNERDRREQERRNREQVQALQTKENASNNGGGGSGGGNAANNGNNGATTNAGGSTQPAPQQPVTISPDGWLCDVPETNVEEEAAANGNSAKTLWAKEIDTTVGGKRTALYDSGDKAPGDGANFYDYYSTYDSIKGPLEAISTSAKKIQVLGRFKQEACGRYATPGMKCVGVVYVRCIKTGS